MADPIKLPPGATLVSAGDSGMKLPPGATLVSDATPAAAPAAPQKPWYQMSMSELADAGIGALKGAGQTAHTAVHAASMGLEPLLNVAEARYAPNLQQTLTPQGTAQKVGAGAEQAGEMMLTGGVLRKGAEALAAKALPTVTGKALPAAARIAAEGVNAGTNAAVHGQSIPAGAAAGVTGGALTEGLAAVAPRLAESALNMRAKDRMYGRTPGAAILNDTTGVTPATVAESAGGGARQLTTALESNAAKSTVPATTDNAVQVIDSAIAKATKQNSATMVQKLTAVRDQLTKDITSGNALPNPTSPEQILNLKRGIGDLVNTWNPQEAKGIQPTIKQVYGALDGELDRTVPGADQLNQKISTLIAVKNRASAVANNADITQRVAHRVAAHTGALAMSTAGAYGGYKEGGLPGAVVGGTLGVMLPEMAASPTTQLTAARLMASHLNQNVLIKIGEGLVLQMTPDGKASVENVGSNDQQNQK